MHLYIFPDSDGNVRKNWIICVQLLANLFPTVSPRSPGGESELGLVSLSFLKCRIVQPSFKCFLIKSSVAFVASVRKGGERGFWARAGSARGSRAVSRPNSLPSPFPVGGGGTPLQEANREVPLERVAFSRLEPDYNGVAFSID